MLSPESKSFTVRALENQIKRTTEAIMQQKNLKAQCERELHKKQGTQHGSGMFALNFEYDESTSSKLLKKANDKLVIMEPKLEGFKKALEEVNNL